MLPSKEKFQYYICPFFVLGSCERPFCHFKHADLGDSARERSPSLSESDTEEKCIPSCPCNNEKSKVIPLGKPSRLLLTKNNEKTTKIPSQSTPPKYNPTPISELQKRVEGEDKLIGNLLSSSEPYSPNGLGTLLTVSYNPSDISNLDKNIANTASYNPTSLSVISNISKEEYKPSGLSEIKLKNYKPSEKNTIKHKEPTYTPEGSENSELNYEPSNKLSIVKQEPEYSPSGGSKNPKHKLEYTPSSSSNISKKDLEYSPLSVAPKVTEKDGENGLQENGSQVSLSYIPTKKSNLSHTPQIVQVDIFAKEKSKSSKPSSSHKSSEKSSSSSKHKRSHSSSSSSRDSKKQKPDSTSSDKKSSSKVTSKDDKNKKKSSHSRSSSSSKHSSSSRHSSSSSSHKDSKNHKQSSSSKDSDKEKSKSRHHSSKKSSHRDKDKVNRQQSSNKSDKDKHSNTANGTKVSEPSPDLLQHESEDYSDLDTEETSDVVLQECVRIFEEFEFEEMSANTQKTLSIQSVSPPKQNNSEVQEEMTVLAAAAKKRVAHEPVSRSLPPPKTSRIRPVSASAGQMLAERWRKQQALQKSKEDDQPGCSSRSSVSDLLNQLMDDAPPKATMSWLKKKSGNENLKEEERTTAQSNGKGKRRVAHTAREEILQRPIVLAAAGDKIPASRRQFVLDKFADNCLKIYPNSNDAFQKAIELEKICFERSNTVAVYNNLFVNQILRLKHAKTPAAVLAMNSQTPLAEVKHVVSYSGGVMERTTITRILDFHGPELYKRLLKYKLLEDERRQHGYPYPHESMDKGKAQLDKVIYPGQSVQQRTDLKVNQRECMRCHEIYTVDKRGMPQETKCYYHPKRLNSVKSKDNSRELRYDCCGYLDSSIGCETNSYHVCETIDYKNLSGFVKTFSKEKCSGCPGIFALDCEMVMTTQGLEIARVSVVDEHQNQVYDALIKPDNPILDYCYEFSGITKEMLRDVKTTLRDVQCVLLNKFSADTILIGHSLNGDLQVLKMLHETVIDTSIVYPHKWGLPHRRKLKTIYKEVLNGNIQNGAEGHDSFEDARACMHLMLHKVREDAKLE